MKVELKPGKYVVAVSGGVDSVVLLDALRQLPNVTLIVAHVDHGIRPDSAQDQKLVAQLADQLGLLFFSVSLKLGTDASEATARKARYKFLETVKREQAADAIVTAHHQDDVIETAIINLTRGTGRRGVTALADSPTLRRPLLQTTKADILSYAQQHNLVWREDSTNSDERYLRNYIRHKIIPKWSLDRRQEFVGYIDQLRRINKSLDHALDETLETIGADQEIERHPLQALPTVIAKELITTWWRQNNFRNYETRTVTRAFQALRRGQTGTIVPLKKPFYIVVGRDKLALHISER